jgi:hypothetical protein
MTFPGTLPGLLLRLFTNHKPELLADKVASRSRSAVWDRVAHRLHTLPARPRIIRAHEPE